MTRRWLIGLSVGCGAGALDAALVELDGIGFELKPLQLVGCHQPIAPELRNLILRVDRLPVESRSMGRLHRLMGETLAAGVHAVVERGGIPLNRVLAVGCPGLVVGRDPEGRFPSALSLGMAAVIAERTGVTVVSEMAARDVSAGGQGTPLTALPDYLLLRHPTCTRLLIHLGGTTRLVWLRGGGRLGDLIGFEAGPCGVLLDAMVRQLTNGKEWCDVGGKHAVQGKCVDELLSSWRRHPLLQRRPPRVIPRHAFADEFARLALQQAKRAGIGLHDLLCTATHFVVRAMTDAVVRYVPTDQPIRQVYLSGGGVRNGLLLRLIAAQWPDVSVSRTDEAGLPAELRQSVAAAVVAALTLDGVPGNVPTVTGAAGSRLLGSLTPGTAANWQRCLQWMSQHANTAAA